MGLYQQREHLTVAITSEDCRLLHGSVEFNSIQFYLYSAKSRQQSHQGTLQIHKKEKEKETQQSNKVATFRRKHLATEATKNGLLCFYYRQKRSADPRREGERGHLH